MQRRDLQDSKINWATGIRLCAGRVRHHAVGKLINKLRAKNACKDNREILERCFVDLDEDDLSVPLPAKLPKHLRAMKPLY